MRLGKREREILHARAKAKRKGIAVNIGNRSSIAADAKATRVRGGQAYAPSLDKLDPKGTAREIWNAKGSEPTKDTVHKKRWSNE